MAAQKSYMAGVQASIEKDIEELEVEANSSVAFNFPRTAPPEPESDRQSVHERTPGYVKWDQAREALQKRVKRLKQLDTWMKEDPDLLKSVDELIGQQVKAAQRRQAMLSACIAVISLAGGWLLSAVPVPVIAHAFGR